MIVKWFIPHSLCMYKRQKRRRKQFIVWICFALLYSASNVARKEEQRIEENRRYIRCNCMAANSKCSREIANLGKRVVNQIFTRDPTHSVTRSTTASHSRAAHISAYDKNLDDQVRTTVVPDEVIPPQSEKYWAPHPQTGVFGPAAVAGAEVANGERDLNSSPANGQNDDTVLEEKAWFRHTSLEDLEKPHHY